MSSVSYRLRRNGVLNLPRASPVSKSLTETLLLKDAQKYHNQFNTSGFHNHLSHHILAAYDLGASPSLLQKIYDHEAIVQRPILLEEKDKDIQITDENWNQYLGNVNAYSGFVAFFNSCVNTFGVVRTLEKFIFSPSANEKDRWMLARLMGGALHPFILVGYGLEFGNDALVSTGLASTAIHDPILPEMYEFDDSASTNASSGNISVLEILHLLNRSSTLKPMPYQSNASPFALVVHLSQEGRPQELRTLSSKFHVDQTLGDVEMMGKIKELVWASVLLMFATGKEGRKPRLDFFLMHLVTASLFLRCYISVLENPAHKAAIIKAFLPGLLVFSMIGGRPSIKPDLLMAATDNPRPPYVSGSPYKSNGTSLGSPLNDEDYNPWPALIEASLYITDSHVLKAMRTLVLAAREYGDTPAGAAIGAYKQDVPSEETHPGASKLDGSIFVRGAGMLMDYMGWTTYGQKERDDWDRSGLGWDEAWNNED